MVNTNYIFDITNYLLLVYFGFSAFYLLFFAIASFFYKENNTVIYDKLRKFLILIPAYKEDKVIISTTKEALQQDYPPELFDIYVIADSFNPDTIKELQNEKRVRCIEVSFEHSTKARSINKALEVITDDYDGVIILDADNIMDTDFIQKVNIAMSRGEKAIQGHRIAKNLDSTFAILDAISEEINNTIFRKGHIAIGISSALIGSGMAFDFDLYKSIMEDIDTYADEDKELEIKLLMKWNKIAYLNDAYVLDEKVSNSQVFVKQRSRWISSQIYYARTFFLKSIYQLLTKANIDFFDKMVQMMLVPRIILLGITFILSLLSFFIFSKLIFYSWLVVFLTCVAALIISVPKKFYNKQTGKAILSLPYGFLMMGLAIFKIKLGHKRLSPTPHHSSKTVNNKK